MEDPSSSESEASAEFCVVRLTDDDWKSGMTIAEIFEKNKAAGKVEKKRGRLEEIPILPEELANPATTVQDIVDRHEKSKKSEGQ